MSSSSKELPRVGLGTYQLTGETCFEVVRSAISAGYRLIDTARCYKNEREIGAAIEATSDLCTRSDLFVTSKVSTKEMTAKGARFAVISSLHDMKIEYLDLVLIHWPGVKGKPLTSPIHREQRFEVFQELLALRTEGLVKHVGVSNFTVKHLQQLSEDCQRVGIVDFPFLNQFEMHPLCAQRELLQYCSERGILAQAYSSFGTGGLISHEAVTEVCKLTSLTPAQALLCWALKRNVAVIPKASSIERLEENLAAERIACNEEEDAALEHLDALDRDHHFCWNPQNVM